MSRPGYKGLLASSALIVVVAVVSDGCGSGDSGSGPMTDASEEPMHIVRRDTGAQSETGGDASTDVTTGGDGAGGAVDGTTGKTCTMDSDCKGPGGPGLNVCSIAGYFRGGPLNPTPLCLSPAPCDLGTGVNVQFCDGSGPTDSMSPGICLPTATAMTGPNGQCFPKCVIPVDGSAPTGCPGKDRCNLFASGTDTTGNPIALGYCLGGCTADSDCPTGSTCQKDEGLCLTTPHAVTKQLGQTCTANDLGSTNYRCNCFYQPMTMLGYCSQFCITGPSSPAPCPSGYVCDPQLLAQVTGLNDASIPGFTKVNPGLAGYCLQACSTAPAGDAGGGVDAAADAVVGDAGDAGDAGGTPPPGPDAQASGMCPVTANCSMQYTAGPDCVP
jgi:hypothetical protein